MPQLRPLALFLTLCGAALPACSGDGATNPEPQAAGDGGADLSAAAAQPDLGMKAPDKLELWYWHGSYLTTDVDKRVEAAEALIDRAAAAGYTGIAFYDSSFQQALRDGFDQQYEKKVVDYATSKGLKTAIPSVGLGASGSIVGSRHDSPLGENPNWAEGPSVAGAQFTVVAGGPSGLQLQQVNSAAPGDFANGTFEAGALANNVDAAGPSNFVTFDDRVTVDTNGCHGGARCGHIACGGSGNERLYHRVALTPHRQYHLSLWVKVSGYSARGGSWPHISLLDARYAHDLLGVPFPTDTAGQWKRFDYLFNSKGNTSLDLLMGIWGGFSAGDIWIDDVAIEEVGLVNVTRRANTPLTMYKAGDRNTVYTEGTHFNPISDPIFLGENGNLDTFHAPPTVSILAAPGAPKLGDTVAIDYHAVTPFYETLGYAPAFACLSEPGVQDFNRRAAAKVATIFPADAGFFMGYDELRVIGNCDHCKAAGTPGQVLAANAQAMVDLLVGPGGVRPGARVYTWSDMFDKFHNAHADYYQVEGDLAGSWKGLVPDVIIFNWHPIGDVIMGTPSDLTASLKFFAGATADQPTPHRQIISGYYDPALTGDAGVDGQRGCASAKASFAKAAGVPGVLGLMYTTWANDYSQLESYATCAQAGWADYKKTL